MAPTFRLCNEFLSRHPAEAARALESLSEDRVVGLLPRLRPDAAAAALAQATPALGAGALARVEPGAAAAILLALDPDVRVALLRAMDEAARGQVLDALGPEVAAELERLLSIERGTIGEIADHRAFTLPEDITTGDGLKRVRQSRQEVNPYIYVVDRSHRLVGVLTTQMLMRSRRAAGVSSVMTRNVAALEASAPRARLVDDPHWRELSALPVVDDEGRFVGVVRQQAVIRVREELEQQAYAGSSLETVLALGELYWMGLSGIMDGLARPGDPPPRRVRREETGRG